MKKKNYSSIPRNSLTMEVLVDWWAVDTNDWTKATLTASNMTYVSSIIGYQKQIWSFNGTSSWITSTSASITCRTISDTSVWSLSFWYKPTWNVWAARQICAWYWSWQWWWCAKDASEKLFFATANSSWATFKQTLSTQTFTQNKWYFITLVFNNTTMTQYINWVQSATETKSWSWTITQTFYIWWSAAYSYHSMESWDYRCYSRALSTNEIQNLYLEWLRKMWWAWDNILASAVAYYDFNWDANDVIGWINWTASNVSSWSDRFWITKLNTYNWTTSKIDLATTTALSTYSFWAWIKTSTTWKQIIWLWNAGNTTVPYMELKTTTWLLTLGTWNWSTSSRVEWTTNVADWNYHFCFVTKSWTSWKVYVDWVLQTSWTCNNINTWTDRWSIWYDRINNVNYHNWQIEDVYIINRELSPDEVKELYNLSKIKYLYPFKKQLPLNLRDGLVFWGSWDTSGTTYYDASWTWNNGTLVNSPTLSRIGQHKRYSFLNASSQYVNLWNTLSFDTNNTFSIFAWINTSTTWTYKTILSKIEWATRYRWYSFWIIDVENSLYIDIINDFSANNWFWQKCSFNICDWKNHLVGVTYNWVNPNLASSYVFYIDWKIVSSSNRAAFTISWTMANSVNASIWWRPNWSFIQWMNWSISNPMVWNKVLTPNEIQQIYYSQYPA